ncbi:hypothetical protein [Amycolatopsis thailandensis]|uniref:hypothetical protein n=1 Tax=Amycolatopsis thailandensis TaxID=589330 RepID=UPI0036324BCF
MFIPGRGDRLSCSPEHRRCCPALARHTGDAGRQLSANTGCDDRPAPRSSEFDSQVEGKAVFCRWPLLGSRLMKIMELSDVLAVVRAASADSLAGHAEQVTQAARELGMRVLPSRVEAGNLVELDSALMTADEVVTTAGAAGTQLLYLHQAVLEERTVDLVLEALEVSADRTRARKAFARVAGWTGRVELGFAHNGILHLWTTETPWYAQLDDLVTSGELEVDPDPFDDDGFDDEKIAELAGQVAAAQEFRRARWSERVAVAETLPVLADLKANPKTPRWTISSVIRKADDLVRLQADDCATALEARKEELAAALASDPKFGEIKRTDGRMRFIDTWIRDHSEGLTIGTWLRKELVVLAVELRKSQGSTQLTL